MAAAAAVHGAGHFNSQTRSPAALPDMSAVAQQLLAVSLYGLDRGLLPKRLGGLSTFIGKKFFAKH